jgi:hypothetical protein
MNFATQSVLARNFVRIVGPVGMLIIFGSWASAGAEPTSAVRSNHCVSRGADFVAVAGSNNCVRLGGHVRVELGAGANVAPAYPGYAADGVQRAASRSHVRTDPISSFMNLFQR